MYFSLIIRFPFLFFDAVSARFFRSFFANDVDSCARVYFRTVVVLQRVGSLGGCSVFVDQAVDYLVFQPLRVFAPIPLEIGTRVISLFFRPADSPPISAGEGSLRLSGYS